MDGVVVLRHRHRIRIIGSRPHGDGRQGVVDCHSPRHSGRFRFPRLDGIQSERPEAVVFLFG